MRLRPIVLCLIAAGCGNGTRNDPYAAVDAALCAWTVKCRGGTADDEAACRAASAERRARAAYSLGEAIASGRAELDGARRDACVASIRGADCAELPSDQCLFIVRGKVPPGGGCKDDSECAGGFCQRGSAFPTPGCDGVCTAYPKRGDACSDRCAPEDYCDATTRVCLARKPAGATCAVGECEIGLQCAGPDGSAVCRGPGQRGESCVPLVTVERSCALGLYCAGQGSFPSGTCTQRVGEGEACTSTPECQDGLLCVAASDGTATCARPLVEGAACVPTPTLGEAGCRLELSCDAASNRCRRLPEPEARACADDSECQTTFEVGAYYCDDATRMCKRRAAVGEACVPQPLPSASCEEGICDATSRTCVLVCS